VDLAGSERLSESGMHAVEETQHINKSLFVLANVIYKLSDTSTQHVPYRDSKLTQILRSALGGNSLTSIICTLSPNLEHTNLTFSTLRFA
jgi:centromeric protein E